RKAVNNVKRFAEINVVDRHGEGRVVDREYIGEGAEFEVLSLNKVALEEIGRQDIENLNNRFADGGSGVVDGKVDLSQKIFANIKKKALFEKFKEEYIKIKNKYNRFGRTIKDTIKSVDEEYTEKLIEVRLQEDESKNVAIFNDYPTSNSKKQLTLEQRQELLNALLSNAFYRDVRGRWVMLSEYLNQYYLESGAKMDIVFRELDPDVKLSIMKSLLRGLLGEEGYSLGEVYSKVSRIANKEEPIPDKIRDALRYFLEDEIAFPHLRIEYNGRVDETILIGGYTTQSSPIYGRKEKSSPEYFIEIRVVRDQNVETGWLQGIITALIHEIDHSVRRATPARWLGGKLTPAHYLFTEGTAEKASLDFCRIQYAQLEDSFSYNGYDLWASIRPLYEWAIYGVLGVRDYAVGYLLAEAIPEEIYWELLYRGSFEDEVLGDVDSLADAIELEVGLPQEDNLYEKIRLVKGLKTVEEMMTKGFDFRLNLLTGAAFLGSVDKVGIKEDDIGDGGDSLILGEWTIQSFISFEGDLIKTGDTQKINWDISGDKLLVIGNNFSSGNIVYSPPYGGFIYKIQGISDVASEGFREMLRASPHFNDELVKVISKDLGYDTKREVYSLDIALQRFAKGYGFDLPIIIATQNELKKLVDFMQFLGIINISFSEISIKTKFLLADIGKGALFDAAHHLVLVGKNQTLSEVFEALIHELRHRDQYYKLLAIALKIGIDREHIKELIRRAKMQPGSGMIQNMLAIEIAKKRNVELVVSTFGVIEGDAHRYTIKELNKLNDKYGERCNDVFKKIAAISEYRMEVKFVLSKAGLEEGRQCYYKESRMLDAVEKTIGREISLQDLVSLKAPFDYLSLINEAIAKDGLKDRGSNSKNIWRELRSGSGVVDGGVLDNVISEALRGGGSEQDTYQSQTREQSKLLFQRSLQVPLPTSYLSSSLGNNPILIISKDNNPIPSLFTLYLDLSLSFKHYEGDIRVADGGRKYFIQNNLPLLVAVPTDMFTPEKMMEGVKFVIAVNQFLQKWFEENKGRVKESDGGKGRDYISQEKTDILLNVIIISRTKVIFITMMESTSHHSLLRRAPPASSVYSPSLASSLQYPDYHTDLDLLMHFDKDEITPSEWETVNAFINKYNLKPNDVNSIYKAARIIQNWEYSKTYGRPITETFKEEEGDCLDKAVALSLVAQRLGFKSGAVVFTPKDGGEGHAICWVDLDKDEEFSEKEIIDLTTHYPFGALSIRENYLPYYAYYHGGCKIQLAGTGKKGELETIYPTTFASQFDGGIKRVRDKFDGGKPEYSEYIRNYREIAENKGIDSLIGVC
ncbi:MAG: hypothetical protein DRP81_06875, partial [Candidatus Omnitrophota bacterium]